MHSKVDVGSKMVPNADVAFMMLINADVGPRVFPSADMASLMLLWPDMGLWGLLGQHMELWSSSKVGTLPTNLDNMTISRFPPTEISQDNTRQKLKQEETSHN